MAFLRVEKKGYADYLRIVESFRNDKGKISQKTLVNLGKIQSYSPEALKGIGEKLYLLGGGQPSALQGKPTREYGSFSYGFVFSYARLLDRLLGRRVRNYKTLFRSLVVLLSARHQSPEAARVMHRHLLPDREKHDYLGKALRQVGKLHRSLPGAENSSRGDPGGGASHCLLLKTGYEGQAPVIALYLDSTLTRIKGFEIISDKCHSCKFDAIIETLRAGGTECGESSIVFGNPDVDLLRGAGGSGRDSIRFYFCEGTSADASVAETNENECWKAKRLRELFTSAMSLFSEARHYTGNRRTIMSSTREVYQTACYAHAALQLECSFLDAMADGDFAGGNWRGLLDRLQLGIIDMNNELCYVRTSMDEAQMALFRKLDIDPPPLVFCGEELTKWLHPYSEIK